MEPAADLAAFGHLAQLRLLDRADLEAVLETRDTSIGEPAAGRQVDEPRDPEPADRRRLYYEGKLTRVEKDLDGNGEIDRWEYYEEGSLVRIGLDNTGDGAADTWQLR